MRVKGSRAGNGDRPGRAQVCSVVQLWPRLCFFCDTIKCHHCKSSSEMGFLIFVAQTSCSEVALQNLSLSVCYFT